MNRNKIRFCSRNSLNLKLFIVRSRRLHFCFSKNCAVLFIDDDDDGDDDDDDDDDDDNDNNYYVRLIQ